MLSSNFRFEGGFNGYWKKLFAFVKESRSKEIDKRPNKACFDVDVDFKICIQVDPNKTFPLKVPPIIVHFQL